MLRNKARDKAVSMNFATSELPFVTLWKNTNALKEGYVTGLEPVNDQPQQGQFAGLFALIRADRGFEDRAHGEAEDHQEPSDREPDAGLLRLWLGIRRLVFRGVGHRHGRAVGDLDGSPLKEP